MNLTKPLPFLPSFLKMRCPQCRKGNVFIDANPYHLKQLGAMNNLCPVCNLNFRPEPGFYFGGSVVSYPLMVIYNLLVTTVFYLITGDIFHHILSLMITLIIATALIAPVTFRYSRIIFLYLVVRYDRSR